MVVLEQRKGSARVRRAPCFGGGLKRGMDILIAIAGLIIMAPLMIVIALAVKLQDGGSILFVQARVGLEGGTFPFLKFRTMVADAPERLQRLLDEDPQAACEWREKQKLTHDPRVTPLGRLLRNTSMDELPQLANVLIGQMSVIGPRPMLPEQVEAYGPGFARYCTARPGLTGLWQVSGRNETTFERRSELDQLYLEEWSVVTDLTLILQTVGVVIGGRGAC